MKKIVTFLLAFSGYTLHAQIITFDYQSRTYTPKESCFYSGSTVSYQLVNINTFAHKVLINGTLISVTTDMPDELAALFRIKNEAVNDNLKDIQQQVEKMVDVKKEAEKQVVKLSNEPASNKRTAAIELMNNVVAETDTLVKDCKAFYKEAEKLSNVLAFEKKVAETMTDEALYNVTSMKQAFAGNGIDSISIRRLKTDYVLFIDTYYNVYEQYKNAAKVSQLADDDVHEDEITNAQEQVEKDYNALKEQYKKSLATIDDLYAKATDPVRFSVTSKPIFIGEGTDEVEFQVKVASFKDDLEKTTPFGKIIRVRGGMKIDYSVGFVFNFISDENYFFDGDKKLHFRNTNANFTPGIAPMVHFYKRTCNTLGWGGVFGINAGFKELTDINLGFLAGLSLIAGRSQKLMFSTGISFSKVSMLKKGEYNVGTTYTDAKIENVTERVLRPAPFISFSYNITKRNPLK